MGKGIWPKVGIQLVGVASALRIYVEEVGRWLHEDAVSAKNSRTAEIIAQIAGEQYESSDEECSDDM